MHRLGHIDLRTLQFFLGVYEQGNFSAIAREQHLSPAQVSRAIQQLEDALGQQLFYRNTRGITATEAARLFAPYARAIMDTLSQSQQALLDQHQTPTGRVRLNASLAFAQIHLAPHLAGLLARYPALEIDLSQTDEFIDPIAERMDITFRISAMTDSRLHARTLARQYHYIVASPSYLARFGKPSSFAELRHHQTLAYQGKNGIDRWLYRQAASESWQPYPLSPVLLANNGETLYNAAVAGMGLALLPDWIVYRGLMTGELVRVLDQYKTTIRQEPRYIAMLLPEQRYQSKAVRAVMDYFIEIFGQTPYWQREL